MLYALIKILAVILFSSIPLWIATRRARGQFRERFGRTPTDLELDSLGAWLKDPEPPPGTATPPASPSSSTQPSTQSSPKTSFGEGPRT
jgi:hypothetical protein